jgi:hypothetical protein
MAWKEDGFLAEVACVVGSIPLWRGGVGCLSLILSLLGRASTGPFSKFVLYLWKVQDTTCLSLMITWDFLEVRDGLASCEWMVHGTGGCTGQRLSGIWRYDFFHGPDVDSYVRKLMWDCNRVFWSQARISDGAMTFLKDVEGVNHQLEHHYTSPVSVGLCVREPQQLGRGLQRTHKSVPKGRVQCDSLPLSGSTKSTTTVRDLGTSYFHSPSSPTPEHQKPLCKLLEENSQL